MNDIQFYIKGLASYEKYCKVCNSACPSAKGDAVKLTHKGDDYHPVVVKKGRCPGLLSINQDPFCTAFLP